MHTDGCHIAFALLFLGCDATYGAKMQTLVLSCLGHTFSRSDGTRGANPRTVNPRLGALERQKEA